MSSIDIELARLVSPTLRRSRSRSTKQAVRTREFMAIAAVGKKKVQGKSAVGKKRLRGKSAVGKKKLRGKPRRPARAEPFIDELLHRDNKVPRGWGPWIALLLTCASAGTGFIIFTAIQNT